MGSNAPVATTQARDLNRITSKDLTSSTKSDQTTLSRPPKINHVDVRAETPQQVPKAKKKTKQAKCNHGEDQGAHPNIRRSTIRTIFTTRGLPQDSFPNNPKNENVPNKARSSQDT